MGVLPDDEDDPASASLMACMSATVMPENMLIMLIVEMADWMPATVVPFRFELAMSP